MFAIGFFTKIQNANAVALEKVQIYGYNYLKYDGDISTADFSDYYFKFVFGDKVAFCLEPDTHITSFDYYETDESGLNLSADMIRRLTLITHYGYDYPGHQTDRYFVATQNLIWKSVTNHNFYVTSELWGEGYYVDLSAEENEIINLVDSHYVRPSFNTEKYEIKLGDNLILTDTNGVLSNYEVSFTSDNVNYSIDGNTITITPTKLGDANIEFKRKNEDIRSTIIFKSDNSQTMGHLGLSDPSMAFLSIANKGGTLSINKIGEKLEYEDNSYSYKQIPLKGAKFDLYAEEDITDGLGNIIYEKGTIIKTEVSNEKGMIYFSDLYLGKYSFKEVESTNNNVVDSKKYYFEITKDNLNIEKKVENYYAKGTLDFSKVDFSTSEPLPNTKIQIFTDDDKQVFEGITDENGKVVINDLPIGKYYIVETEAPVGYTINEEKMPFEIKENKEVVKSTMKDEKIVRVPFTEANRDYTFDVLIFAVVCIALILIFIGFKNGKK